MSNQTIMLSRIEQAPYPLDPKTTIESRIKLELRAVGQQGGFYVYQASGIRGGGLKSIVAAKDVPLAEAEKVLASLVQRHTGQGFAQIPY